MCTQYTGVNACINIGPYTERIRIWRYIGCIRPCDVICCTLPPPWRVHAELYWTHTKENMLDSFVFIIIRYACAVGG